MHWFDIFILVIYLVLVTYIGIRTMRRVKNIQEFFMPRKFGKTMMVMFTFGAGTHADQAVSVASASYTYGLSGIWYQWLWLFATPFYWLIAPVMRRFRAITTADVFEARYDRTLAMLFAFIGSLNLMISIGVMLKGAGAVIDATTGGLIPADLAIFMMTIIFVIYGIAGGLQAAIITDFIQGVLTIILSFILLPLILNAVGGLSGMRETIANPAMFSLVAPEGIGVFYILVISFNALVGIVTQPHTMGNCAAGKTEFEGQIGFMGGSVLKRICTVAWSLTGLAAVAYFAGQTLDPDLIFGKVARIFLPGIMPGLIGVFLASILASMMSSCDAFMIASSGLFTENAYKKLVPNKSVKHYLAVARIVSLIVVAGGLLFAYWLPGVIKGLEMFWKIAPMMGIAFWLGLFWRRTTSAGAWASTVSAFLIWILTEQQFFVSLIEKLPFAESLRLVVERSWGVEIYLPWQMIAYLGVGTVTGIIVSLFTKAVDEKKLDNFYALVRTPVAAGEKVLEPCTIPENSPVPPKNLLFNFGGLEINRPSRNDIVGFLVGCIFVVAIILSVYMIAK